MKAPGAINDPAHWRQRADEARRLADQLTDTFAKQTMQQVAASYEHLARLAQDKPLQEE